MPKTPSPSTLLVAALAVASAVPAAQHKKLAAFGVQVLAFGDSMTQGCTEGGLAGCDGANTTYPYAAFTHESLKQARPGMANVSSMAYGNMYSTQMAESLRKELGEKKPDVVLIMAGGKDMLQWFISNIPKGKQNFSEPDEKTAEMLKVQVETMVTNIAALHKAAHDVLPNVKTVAVGYPMVERVWELGDGAIDAWEGLSQRLQEGSGADDFIDMNEIFPYDEIEENSWKGKDKIHFTEAGFRMMGTRMAEKLTDVLTIMAGAVQMLQENGVGGITGFKYF